VMHVVASSMVMMMFVAVVIVMRLVVHIRTFPGFVIESLH